MSADNPYHLISENLVSLKVAHKEHNDLELNKSCYYPGCLLCVIDEKNVDQRQERLRQFLLSFVNSGDPSYSQHGLSTVMNIWQLTQSIMYRATVSEDDKLAVKFFIDAGLVECMLRVLNYKDKDFLMTNYNIHLPFRCIEILDALTEPNSPLCSMGITHLLHCPDIMVLYDLLKGSHSWLEAAYSIVIFGNIAQSVEGFMWIFDRAEIWRNYIPYLWDTFDIFYKNYIQYSDHRIYYHQYVLSHDYFNRYDQCSNMSLQEIAGKVHKHALKGFIAYLQNSNHTAESLESFVELLLDCGFIEHFSGFATGVISSDYVEGGPIEVMIIVEKLCSIKLGRDAIMKQQEECKEEKRGPFTLIYFNSNGNVSKQTVLSCLLTHAVINHPKAGSDLAVKALFHLLKDTGWCDLVVKLAGPELFDIAHNTALKVSTGGFRSDDGKMHVQRALLEYILKFGGVKYKTKSGGVVSEAKSSECEGSELPPYILEAKEMCRKAKEQEPLTLEEKNAKLKEVEGIKAKGNQKFKLGRFELAADLYSQAIDKCPLSAKKKLVLLYSKRAECYLRLHKTNKTITDANRAVALDYLSTISRWRRQEATQAVEPYFQFLDLRLIKDREVDDVILPPAKNIMEMGDYFIETAGFPSQARKKHGRRDNNAADAAFHGQTFEEAFGFPPPSIPEC